MAMMKGSGGGRTCFHGLGVCLSKATSIRQRTKPVKPMMRAKRSVLSKETGLFLFENALNHRRRSALFHLVFAQQP